VHSDDGDLRGLFRQAPPGKFNCLRRLRPNLQPWPLMEQRRCSAFAAISLASERRIRRRWLIGLRHPGVQQRVGDREHCWAEEDAQRVCQSLRSGGA
jgi:hypothetical protein